MCEVRSRNEIHKGVCRSRHLYWLKALIIGPAGCNTHMKITVYWLSSAENLIAVRDRDGFVCGRSSIDQYSLLILLILDTFHKTNPSFSPYFPP